MDTRLYTRHAYIWCQHNSMFASELKLWHLCVNSRRASRMFKNSMFVLTNAVCSVRFWSGCNSVMSRKFTVLSTERTVNDMNTGTQPNARRLRRFTLFIVIKRRSTYLFYRGLLIGLQSGKVKRSPLARVHDVIRDARRRETFDNVVNKVFKNPLYVSWRN